MNKYKSLMFSSLVFTLTAGAGFLCIQYFLIAEERHSLAEMTVVSSGLNGLTALVLSAMTYFFLERSEKLRTRASGLTETNQRLRDEIIQRKAAEEKSANMAEEWARTFDAIPDYVSIHSNDFRIIRANQALADFLGMGKEEITGKFCYEVFHGTKEAKSGCPHVRTMETKKPVTVERCDVEASSHSMVSTSPIFNKQQEVIGTVHIIKDTTEMKRLEEQLRHAQKMEAVVGSREGSWLYIEDK